jgi:uncharacterized protein (TIGR02118 family)
MPRPRRHPKSGHEGVRYMIKIVTLITKKDGLTQEEFSRYWEQEHGPLVMKLLPGVKRYVQNHAVRRPIGRDLQIDGIVELWFEDAESSRAAADFLKSDEGKALRDDEDKFLDRSKTVFFTADEKVIKG